MNLFDSSFNLFEHNLDLSMNFYDSQVLDELSNEINQEYIEYDNTNYVYNMTISNILNNILNVKLQHLDGDVIKLNKICINTTDNNLKLGNIEFIINNFPMRYPIIFFNITKTNTGYEIDLSKLYDYGWKDIYLKLVNYVDFNLNIHYEGKIESGTLFYSKNKLPYISNNLEKSVPIKNISLLEIESDSLTINTPINFNYNSTKFEILCNDIEKDLLDVKIYFNNESQNIYLEKLKNKIIANFDKPINLSNIDKINLTIKFKSQKNRNIIIFNEFKNIITYSQGLIGIKHLCDSFKINMKDINIINNEIEINEIDNNILNILDMHYI
jgi:hypothetical protein